MSKRMHWPTTRRLDIQFAWNAENSRYFGKEKFVKRALKNSHFILTEKIAESLFTFEFQ